WTRHSSSPSSSPCITGLMRLAFESTQHGADVLLAASRQLEEDLFQRLSVLSDHVAELLEAAHGHQTSAVDDGEAGAHPLRDLQDVGREENRLPFLAEVLEYVFHLAGALRIEANRGLVEEEHLGVVEQGPRQRAILPHASRVARKEIVAPLPQVEELEQRLDAAIPKAGLDVVEVAGKLEELSSAQLVIEGRGVRDVADLCLGPLRLRRDVDSCHPGAAGGGAKQPNQHFDGGRLPRADWAEESEKLPGRDFQVQVLHRRQAAVALAEKTCGRHRAQCSGGPAATLPRMALREGRPRIQPEFRPPMGDP